MRVTDLTKPLTALPLKARILILNAARANTFAQSPHPLVGGLALMQPDAGTLIAFNAAPGTIAPESKTSYGAYATALTEMIKGGGQPLNDVFERVRLRVNVLTTGAQVSWHVSRMDPPFLFFERAAEAPPAEQKRFANLRDKPIRELAPKDACVAVVARDNLKGYEEFVSAFPRDPQVKRVRALAAARREAAT